MAEDEAARLSRLLHSMLSLVPQEDPQPAVNDEHALAPTAVVTPTPSVHTGFIAQPAVQVAVYGGRAPPAPPAPPAAPRSRASLRHRERMTAERVCLLLAASILVALGVAGTSAGGACVLQRETEEDPWQFCADLSFNAELVLLCVSSALLIATCCSALTFHMCCRSNVTERASLLPARPPAGGYAPLP